MARIEAKMQSLGLFESCSKCGRNIMRGETMNAVVNNDGEPQGWCCDKCIEEWKKNGGSNH